MKHVPFDHYGAMIARLERAERRAAGWATISWIGALTVIFLLVIGWL